MVVGQTFGQLTVISSVGMNKHHQQVLKCQRPDGQHVTVKLSNLYRLKKRELNQ